MDRKSPDQASPFPKKESCTVSNTMLETWGHVCGVPEPEVEISGIDQAPGRCSSVDTSFIPGPGRHRLQDWKNAPMAWMDWTHRDHQSLMVVRKESCGDRPDALAKDSDLAPGETRVASTVIDRHLFSDGIDELLIQ